MIAVAGASGFIGRHFCNHAVQMGHRCVRLLRTPLQPLVGTKDRFTDYGNPSSLEHAMAGCSVLVNLAGAAHGSIRDEKDHQSAEIDLVSRLLTAAEASGVERIVHLSSIGAELAENQPDSARPYGRAKHAAELVALEHSQPVVVLRPPAVYGLGAPGNCGRIETLIRRDIPLPFGSLETRRHYIDVNRLCDAILEVITASPETFRLGSIKPLSLADPDSMTTADLSRKIAKACEKPVRLLPVPTFLLKLILKVMGRHELADGLLSPLMVSNERFTEIFRTIEQSNSQ